MRLLIYLELELSLVLVMLLGTGMASIEMCQRESSCSCVTDSNRVTDLSDLRAVYFSVYVRDNTTISEYRYYPCGIVSDWDDEICTRESGASVCLMEITNGRPEFTVIGQKDNTKFEVEYREPYTTLLTYKYTRIHLICTEGAEMQGDTFSIGSETYGIYPQFILITRHACPILRDERRNNPVIFILVCIFGGVGIVTYLVCGMLYQIYAKDAKKWEILPNLGFWKETPFLFRDGFLLVFSCYKPFRESIGK